MLETHINPYLEWFWEAKAKFQLDAGENISQWHSTHLPNTCKVALSHTDLAHCVCCSLIDKDVQQVDWMSSLIFISSFHKLAKAGLGNYFSQYALCDAHVSTAGDSRVVASSSTYIGDWACP